MKESWKTINQLLNKRSKTTNIESLKDDKGNIIVDKQEIAETMNIIIIIIIIKFLKVGLQNSSNMRTNKDQLFTKTK